MIVLLLRTGRQLIVTRALLTWPWFQASEGAVDMTPGPTEWETQIKSEIPAFYRDELARMNFPMEKVRGLTRLRPTRTGRGSGCPPSASC